MSWLLVGVLIGLPSAARAADASGFGIVKGTITVGGKPAPDAVVSIEGLAQDQIKNPDDAHQAAEKNHRSTQP